MQPAALLWPTPPDHRLSNSKVAYAWSMTYFRDASDLGVPEGKKVVALRLRDAVARSVRLPDGWQEMARLLQMPHPIRNLLQAAINSLLCKAQASCPGWAVAIATLGFPRKVPTEQLYRPSAWAPGKLVAFPQGDAANQIYMLCSPASGGKWICLAYAQAEDILVKNKHVDLSMFEIKDSSHASLEPQAKRRRVSKTPPGSEERLQGPTHRVR